jgi:hypothetical protein
VEQQLELVVGSPSPNGGLGSVYYYRNSNWLSNQIPPVSVDAADVVLVDDDDGNRPPSWLRESDDQGQGQQPLSFSRHRQEDDLSLGLSY